MRRVIIAITLSLLLGLLTSIAIAWGAATSFNDHNAAQLEFIVNGWYGAIDQTPTATRVRVLKNQTRPDGSNISPPYGFTRDPADPPLWLPVDTSPDTSGITKMQGMSTGWPMRCMYFYTTNSGYTLFPDWDEKRYGIVSGVNFAAMRSPNALSEDIYLPIKPIFFGLFINTIVFALLVPVALSLPYITFRSRLRARIKKHRCIKCKYDLRTTPDMCPECGMDQRHSMRLIHKSLFVLLIIWTVVIFLKVSGFAAFVHFWPDRSAFLRAAYTGDIETLQRLYDAGEDVNTVYEKYHFGFDERYTFVHTPLEVASAAGQLDTVQWLVDHGANVNAGLVMDTALCSAMSWDRLEVAQLLIDSGAQINLSPIHLKTYVYFAGLSGNPAFMDVLAEQGVDFSTQGEALTACVKQSLDIYSYRRSRLTDGQRECIARMLELGCPVTPEAVEHTLFSCDTNSLRILAAYCDVNIIVAPKERRETTLLMDVMNWKCKDEMIRVLLEANIDVNASISSGRTALIAAAEQRGASTVQLLLEYSADPNASTTQARTPLYFAIVSSDIVAVELLLNAGADPTAIIDDVLKFTTPQIRELIESAHAPTSP